MDWKVATFNVNGIRARLSCVLDWIRKHDPDVLCLQEIKCQTGDFPRQDFENLGYTASVRGQKAFHGVATLTKRPPLESLEEFADWGPDSEARFLAVLVDHVWVVNTYVPQGRSIEDPAFQFKLEFFRRLRSWFQNRFDPMDAVVWLGDMNVAPTPLDLFDPHRYEGSVGFHPAERSALQEVISWGFTDLFRLHQPDTRQFTFWDYRLPRSFQKNLGWRIDHILASAPLANACKGCRVDDTVRGEEKPSDHAPVIALLDLPDEDKPGT